MGRAGRLVDRQRSGAVCPGLVADRKNRFHQCPGGRHTGGVDSTGGYRPVCRRIGRSLEPQSGHDRRRLVYRPGDRRSGGVICQRSYSHLAHLWAVIYPFVGRGLPLARHAGLHLADGARASSIAPGRGESGLEWVGEHRCTADGSLSPRAAADPQCVDDRYPDRRHCRGNFTLRRHSAAGSNGRGHSRYPGFRLE